MTTDEHTILNEVRDDIKTIFVMLKGDDKGTWGLLSQVRFMWKMFWVWPLCSLSAVAGAIATIFIQHIKL